MKEIINELRTLIIDDVPKYHFRRNGKKRHYKSLKLRIANWLMEGWIDKNHIWYNKLLKALKEN